MVTKTKLLAVLAMLHVVALPAQTYRTAPRTEDIKTLRVIVDGDYRKLPVIDLSSARGEGNSRVEVSFDYLADEQAYLTYRLVHCNAQWQADDLSELDYLEGVMPVNMDDNVEASFNTITSTYYHYEVCFPNEDVRLLVSGNYAVVFSPDNDPDETVAVATFSVSEQGVFVGGEVSGNTDIDYRQQHQQLALSLSWSEQQLPYLQPADDLQLVVRQNRRNDTKRIICQPLRFSPGKALYEHTPQLIFEGGNNWRQFENNDERYPGIRVDHLRFTHQGYDAWLMTDKSRAHREFLTEPDIRGRFLVHAVKVDDADVEAEYCWVHFSLEASPALDEAGIYLLGDFTYGERSEAFRMEYDPELQLYAKDVYLKQGAYNYLYDTSVVEGNHYETPNEYDVSVYYRPFGARYDRLLGVGIIK